MAIEVRDRIRGRVYVPKVRDPLGRWFESTTFDRRVDAQREERRLLSLRDLGRRSSPVADRDITLAQYWMRWSEDCRSRASNGWKGSQDQMARDYLLPDLGHVKINELKPVHIEKMLTSLESKGYASATRLHAYNLLHKMLSDAVEFYELIPQNPVMKKQRPRLESKARKYLSPIQARVFLLKVKEHWIGPAIWIGLLSGLRPCEIQALQVKHLDFDNHEVLIRRSFNRKEKRIQEHTKQKDAGIAPMPVELAKLLKETTAGKNHDAFVIEAANGGMLSYHTFNHALKRLCAEAGVTVITPHELRHSCTELYVEMGASEEDVKRLLNHKSSSSTKVYMHRTGGRLGAIAANVAVKPAAALDTGASRFQVVK